MYKSLKVLALLLAISSQLVQAQPENKRPQVPAPPMSPAPAEAGHAPAASGKSCYAYAHPMPAPHPAPSFTHIPHPPLPPVPWNYNQALAFNDQDPAANPAIEKTKKITKTFKVGKDDKLQIDNRYGKVHVNTTNKNEISVEITIIGRGATESAAQQILDKIKITETQENNLISLRTQLEQVTSKGGGSGHGKNHTNGKSFEINYLVNMPKNNPVAITNRFGDTYLAEFNGITDLDVSYGNLKTEKLNGGNNNIKLKFGSGNILYAKQCSLNVAYSNLRLDGSETLDLQSKFSELTLPQLEDIIIKSKYDKLKIGKVNSMQGSTGYSDCRVDNLHNTMDMKVQYCSNFEVKNASKNFKQISLEGGYSTFNLNFDDNTAFNFDVDLEYGNLKADKEMVNFNLVEKERFVNEYQGKYGKAGAKSNVNIKAKYGDVKFMKAAN